MIYKWNPISISYTNSIYITQPYDATYGYVSGNLPIDSIKFYHSRHYSNNFVIVGNLWLNRKISKQYIISDKTLKFKLSKQKNKMK